MKSSKSQSLRIDADAAIALVEWKALFAKTVAETAHQLAAKSKTSVTVTLADYRRAAQQALLTLTAAIESGESVDGQQKAA